MPWSRASSLDRATVCPGSTHLAQLETPSKRRDDAAEWGNLVHAWKESGEWPVRGSDGNTLSKSTVQALRRRNAALLAGDVTHAQLWPGGEHEVAVALNTRARIVARYEGPPSSTREEREAWKASFDDEWVTGTIDWLGDYLGTAWVDDLKTGNIDYIPEDPWDLWQMRVYAVCAAMLTGASEVTVSLTCWPRYPADGLPVRRWTSVSTKELLGITLPLLEQARKNAMASREQLIVVPGESQCRFCPSKHVCPMPWEPPILGEDFFS